MAIVSPTSFPSPYTQPALSAALAGHASGLLADRLGAVLTDEQDVEQCFYVILETPKGSDPLRPTFGSDVWRYLDSPIDTARPHVVREVTDSIRLWEPRAVLTSVQVFMADTEGATAQGNAHLNVALNWRWANNPAVSSVVSRYALRRKQ